MTSITLRKGENLSMFYLDVIVVIQAVMIARDSDDSMLGNMFDNVHASRFSIDITDRVTMAEIRKHCSSKRPMKR